MLPKTHLGFTEQLLKATHSEHMYLVWSNIPDQDMFHFHRYTYHQISSFNKLFERYGDKQQCKKTIALTLLGHLYIDSISGPVKIFNGLNFTCSPFFFNSFDYMNGIKKVFAIIHNTDIQFQDKVCNIFNDLNSYSVDIYIELLFDRLVEMTIGRMDLDKEIKTLSKFIGKPIYSNTINEEYNKAYLDLISMEKKINNIIMEL